MFFFQLGFIQKGKTQSSGVPQKKYVKGVVVEEKVFVREKPIYRATILDTLLRNKRVYVFSKHGDWFRVKYKNEKNIIKEGWIEQIVVQLIPWKDISPAPLSPRIPEIQTKTEIQASPLEQSRVGELSSSTLTNSRIERSDTLSSNYYRRMSEMYVSKKHLIRFFCSPVFDVYRFGATQYRIGGAYVVRLSDEIGIGFPASYSIGDGFSSIQTGLEGHFPVLIYKKYVAFSRIGLLFERFSGKGRSLLSGTIDLALGIEYSVTDHFFFSIEPVSLEAMFISSQKIPWNLRGQVMMEMRLRW